VNVFVYIAGPACPLTKCIEIGVGHGNVQSCRFRWTTALLNICTCRKQQKSLAYRVEPCTRLQGRYERSEPIYLGRQLCNAAIDICRIRECLCIVLLCLPPFDWSFRSRRCGHSRCCCCCCCCCGGSHAAGAERRGQSSIMCRTGPQAGCSLRWAASRPSKRAVAASRKEPGGHQLVELDCAHNGQMCGLEKDDSCLPELPV
jgi:hypothetical protein